MTNIFDACADGNLNLVKTLLQEVPERINQTHPEHGTSPLCFAIEGGYIPVIEYMLQNGAKEIHDAYGCPLHLFWVSHCEDKVKRLEMLHWFKANADKPHVAQGQGPHFVANIDLLIAINQAESDEEKEAILTSIPSDNPDANRILGEHLSWRASADNVAGFKRAHAIIDKISEKTEADYFALLRLSSLIIENAKDDAELKAAAEDWDHCQDTRQRLKTFSDDELDEIAEDYDILAEKFFAREDFKTSSMLNQKAAAVLCKTVEQNEERNRLILNVLVSLSACQRELGLNDEMQATCKVAFIYMQRIKVKDLSISRVIAACYSNYGDALINMGGTSKDEVIRAFKAGITTLQAAMDASREETNSGDYGRLIDFNVYLMRYHASNGELTHALNYYKETSRLIGLITDFFDGERVLFAGYLKEYAELLLQNANSKQAIVELRAAVIYAETASS